jgi:replicative DNA helicase
MAKIESILTSDPSTRILPHNEEAERNVLGAILLDTQAILDIMDLIDEYCFYHTGNAIIYRTMKDLYARNTRIDHITLTEALSNQGKLDAVGGIFYLTTLVENVVTTSNILHHANILRDKYIARRLVQAAEHIAQKSLEQNIDTESLVLDAERLIFDIAQKKEHRDIQLLSNLLTEGMNVIQDSFKNRGLLTGIPTGYKNLDNLTGGFQKSDLIIIAARPSVGKTALALNIASYGSRPLAAKKAYPVLLFSLEMSKEQIVQRMLCTEAGVTSEKIRRGFLSNRNWDDLFNAAKKLNDSVIYIDDTPGISVLELRAKAMRLKVKVPELSMIVVDYLQLMTGRARIESRQQEISEISRSLKALARELKIPVIALSQLNRQVEQRGPDARPKLSDLRESGALEQDADVIIFLHRPAPEPGKENIPQATDNVYEIIVAKHRNGPTDTVKLAFIKDYTRFVELYDSSSGSPQPEPPPEDEEESHEA